MSSKLVLGNWKMHGAAQANQALLSALVASVPGQVDVAVCVPYPYLAQARALLTGSPIALGAQNVSEYAQGAYTGEVGAAMLGEFDCRYVIVGHSERRTLFGESDAVVARKAAAVLHAGMVPVVCIGETLAQREAGQVEDVLEQQLDALASVLSVDQLGGLVVAYEPVWAIGTGQSATAGQVQEALGLVRGWLRARVRNASAVKILYGGSVKAATAGELFSLPDADGGLIGGASLVAAEFLAICEAARDASQSGLIRE
jgi:triosephosphate isomerase